MTIEDTIHTPVLPVVVIDDADKAEPLAEAFLEAGLAACEITFRTAAAPAAIRRIATAFPTMMVGAGTVLTVEQAGQALDAGSRFGLAPGLDPEVLEVFQNARVPFVPGVMTPSETTRAINLGCRYLKFFPAETAGGPAALKAMIAPFKPMNPRFCPTGGVSIKNLGEYLAIPEVFTVGGSWLATREDIANGDWEGIKTKVREALAVG